MEKLDQMFWIDQQKLKDITKQFEVELDLGLKKNNQNIVCFSTLDTLPD
jgi:hexokinase